MWENAENRQVGSDFDVTESRARLKHRSWVPSASEALVRSVADAVANVAPPAVADQELVGG